MKASVLTWLLAISAPLIALACDEAPDYNVIRAHKRMLAKRQNNLASPPPASASASSSSHSGTVIAAPTSSSAPAPPAPPAPPAGGSSTGAAPSGTVTGTPSAPAGPAFTPPTDPYATIPLSAITSGAPSEALPTLATTYQAGATPPVSGAPLLPSLTLNAAAYPPENTVPPTDSPQVQEWMKEIAGISQDILNIPPTKDGSCAGDPQAAADTSRCWWTCGGCTNNTQGVQDIVTCPNKMTWGLSFDDGPAPYSPKVIKFLSDKDLTATFFIVGSRVIERPDILRAEYMLGHHIAAHTWSHSIPLTALTNEQVVAELAWSRQIIKEVTGVSPVYMRPPWGDIDNRVRAISLALGMRPIIWTRDPKTGEQFDTNDWKVPGGVVSGTESNQQFQNILTNATQLDTGFIVLEHDLFEQEVDLATGYSIPQALQANFKLMDINTCLGGQPADAYLETISDKSKVPTYPGAGSVDVSGNGTTVPGTGNGTSGGASKGGAVDVPVPWKLISSVFVSAIAGVALLL